MAKNKKPRKAYRPADRIMPVPPAFGTQSKTQTLLALRTREAIDAMISGSGAWEDMMAADSDLVCAIHLQRIAAKRPAEHQVEPEAIAALCSELVGIARAMRGIKDRHDRTASIGVNGEERAAMLRLADIMDEMRQALPRRLWLMAYRTALDRPVVRIKDSGEIQS